MVGVLLVGYGVARWGTADAPDKTLPPDGAQSLALPHKPEKTAFDKYYWLFVNYLIFLPGAIALVCWTLSFKLIGCEMSSASMEVYGCSPFGRAIAYVYLYSAILVAVMLTVFVPVTVVYLAQSSGRKPSSRK